MQTRSSKPTIATLLHAADSRARIVTGGRDAFEIAHYERLADLLHDVATRNVALVVVDAADRQGRSYAAVVSAIHTAYETLPIFVYCTTDTARSIPDLVRAGATDIILRGVDDVGVTLRSVLGTGVRALLRREIYDELAPLLPSQMAPLLRFAMECSDDDMSVRAAAVALGVDRKTLRNRLSRATGMSPRELINFVRLCIAVGMLIDQRQTAERVALELGFPSGTAFRNMLRRYTGRPSSAFRGRQGFSAILGLVKQRIAARTGTPTAEEVKKPLMRVVSP